MSSFPGNLVIFIQPAYNDGNFREISSICEGRVGGYPSNFGGGGGGGGRALFNLNYLVHLKVCVCAPVT